VRSSGWSGIGPGDRVEVSGVGVRGATWEFVAHVRNSRTGDEWVEVVGGRPGDRKLRSFSPDRIFPHRARGSGGPAGASLADAPQLPLG
jgi:hypothetical protein